MRILVRGAGDIASGIAWRLWQSGFEIIMTDLPQPTAIRRSVAFSTALEEGRFVIEGVTAVRCQSAVSDTHAELRGAVVTMEQAAMLAKRLGLVIKA